MLQAVIGFLEEQVNGKTLYTPELSYGLEDGALRGQYADQISFCNLKYNQYCLQLDMFIVANEKIFTAAGELRKDFSAVSLFRYELAQRQSTGALTGLFRFISASGKGTMPPEAVVSSISQVRLADGELSWFEEQALYRDQLTGEAWKPVAFQARQRFYLEDGKLHFDYDGQSFDIDGQTLRRSGHSDAFPPFHSQER